LNWLAPLGASNALPKLHGRQRRDEALLRPLQCAAYVVRSLRL
jgi:hypothetical protein